MKILILTTNTCHHNFYVHKLLKNFEDITVIEEKKITKPKYHVFHEFEIDRDNYEKKLWNKVISIPLKKVCKNYLICNSINNLEIVNYVKKENFDICLVFGTQKINNNLLFHLPFNAFNLHGGDPNYYRGLDSHLWSIWHLDTKGLKVCLHRLSSTLDDGDIFMMSPLNIKSIKFLYQLRSINTDLCVQLSLDLLNLLISKKKLKCNPQNKIGRYYTYMPSVLKSHCIENFKKMKLI